MMDEISFPAESSLAGVFFFFFFYNIHFSISIPLSVGESSLSHKRTYYRMDQKREEEEEENSNNITTYAVV